MALIKGYAKQSVSENISDMITGGYAPARAIAAALTTARAVWKKRFPDKALPMRLKKSNPETISKVLRKQVAKGVALYRKFSGMEPKFVRKVSVPKYPSTLIAIGPCDGILYTTVRDSKTEEYIHKFKRGKRPLLCSSVDGKQLFLLGGSYDFTQDGIVDR